MTATITLGELYAMQEEAENIAIPGEINQFVDDLLCELRRNEVIVSDRKFLNYGAIARAAAWLNRHDSVQPSDLLWLKNYLWNEPQEIAKISEILEHTCVNPLKTSLDALVQRAQSQLAAYQQAGQTPRAMQGFRKEMVRLYDEWLSLQQSANGGSTDLLNATLDKLEDISHNAHTASSFTYISLAELKQFSV